MTVSEPKGQFDLTIVIVNYNGGEQIVRCLASLHSISASARVSAETVVVDNASTDGSAEAIASQLVPVKLIRAALNLGFAGGCNLGMENALGRHILLLNPDTELLPNSLDLLVQALDDHPDWGIVGPRMLDGDGKIYRAARRFPRPLDLFLECTRLLYVFPGSPLVARYFYAPQKPQDLDEVDQIEGSALMIRAEILREVGMLDTQFFIFFEEVDWCRRVKAAGYEIHVVQQAEVKHYRSTTMSRFYVESRRHHAASACAYFLKHHGERGLQSLRRWMFAGLLIREWGSRLLGLLRVSARASLKAEGAQAERRVYREWGH